MPIWLLCYLYSQLLKLVDVVNTADMTMDDHIERELLLLKVKTRPETAQALLSLLKDTRVRVLDDCPETYTLELTGQNIHMDEFISKVGDCARQASARNGNRKRIIG